jgi:hypothetical protein
LRGPSRQQPQYPAAALPAFALIITGTSTNPPGKNDQPLRCSGDTGTGTPRGKPARRSGTVPGPRRTWPMPAFTGASCAGFLAPVPCPRPTTTFICARRPGVSGVGCSIDGRDQPTGTERFVTEEEEEPEHGNGGTRAREQKRNALSVCLSTEAGAYGSTQSTHMFETGTTKFEIQTLQSPQPAHSSWSFVASAIPYTNCCQPPVPCRC